MAQALLSEGLSTTTSMASIEETLVRLAMAAVTPNTPLDELVCTALDSGVSEDEIQAVADLAKANEHSNQANQIISLLAQYQRSKLPKPTLINLGDHKTQLLDSAPNDTTSVPIILLHALTMDAHMWRAIFPSLAKTTRVLAYDIRGFGTAHNAPQPSSIYTPANDLHHLLSNLQIPKADIYGISYGGAIAQAFALTHPQQTRSIAAIATLAKGLPILLDRATAAETHGMDSLVAPTLLRWFSADIVARNPWQVRYARMCVRCVGVESWATAWRNMAEMDFVGGLSRVRVPVLAVAGEKDASAPPEMLKTIAEKTGGKYVEIPQGMHMLNLEHPEELLAALQKFRGEVDLKAHRTPA